MTSFRNNNEYLIHVPVQSIKISTQQSDNLSTNLSTYLPTNLTSKKNNQIPGFIGLFRFTADSTFVTFSGHRENVIFLSSYTSYWFFRHRHNYMPEDELNSTVITKYKLGM